MVIIQNTEHRGNMGTPATSLVKNEIPDLATPQAIEENGEIVVTSETPLGRVNQTTSPQISLNTKEVIFYRTFGLIMGYG